MQPFVSKIVNGQAIGLKNKRGNGKHCAGCSDCLKSKARTGVECVLLRKCRCHNVDVVITPPTRDKIK